MKRSMKKALRRATQDLERGLGVASLGEHWTPRDILAGSTRRPGLAAEYGRATAAEISALTEHVPIAAKVTA